MEIKKNLNIQLRIQTGKKNNWEYEINSDTELLIKKPHKFRHHGVWDKKDNLILDLSHNAGFIGQIKEGDVSVLKDANLDGVIAKDEYDLFGKQKVGEKTWYFVFEPSQIHILGSQKDIQGFKEFVQSQKGDSLEKRTITAVFIAFLFAGLFFSTPSLTGNLILNQNSVLQNYFGFLILLIGSVGFFFSNKYIK